MHYDLRPRLTQPGALGDPWVGVCPRTATRAVAALGTWG